MDRAPMPDMGAGIMYLYLGIIAPIVMFVPVVLCEAIVLRRVLRGRRVFWMSVWANLITTVLGAVAGVYIVGLAMKLTRAITGAGEFEISYEGKHGNVILPTAIIISWLLSVLVEGVLLLVMRPKRRRSVRPTAETPGDRVAGGEVHRKSPSSIPRILVASLIANSTSYALIAATWFLGALLFEGNGVPGLCILTSVLLALNLDQRKRPTSRPTVGALRTVRWGARWGLASFLYLSVLGTVRYGAVFGALFGSVVSAGQYIVLHRCVRRAGWWIWSMISWIVGWAIAWSAIQSSLSRTGGVNSWRLHTLLYCPNESSASGFLVVGWVIGATLSGVAQWRVWRCFVPAAGWWIVASVT